MTRALAAPIALLILLVLGGSYFALREQGPMPVFVLIGRYTLAPFLAIPLALATAVGLVIWPDRTLLAAGVALWIALVVCTARTWGPRTWARALRRMAIRSMWPSVARSSDLAVRRDRRSRRWPGGVTSTVVGAEIVEHLPRIWHGRGLRSGAGVVYRVRPAKGATLADIAKAAPNLAAGLHVHRVTVERVRPDRGRLTVLYRDTLTEGS